MSKQLKSQARNSYFYPRHNFLHHTFKQLPNKHQTSTNCAWRAKYHFQLPSRTLNQRLQNVNEQGPHAWWCMHSVDWHSGGDWPPSDATRKPGDSTVVHQKAVKNAVHGGLHEHSGVCVRVTQLQLQTNTSNGPLSVHVRLKKDDPANKHIVLLC